MTVKHYREGMLGLVTIQGVVIFYTGTFGGLVSARTTKNFLRNGFVMRKEFVETDTYNTVHRQTSYIVPGKECIDSGGFVSICENGVVRTPKGMTITNETERLIFAWMESTGMDNESVRTNIHRMVRGRRVL